MWAKLKLSLLTSHYFPHILNQTKSLMISNFSLHPSATDSEINKWEIKDNKTSSTSGEDMTETIWQRETCSPGREYMLGTDPCIKYDDKQEIIALLKNNLKNFIQAEPAVRITLDAPTINPGRTILAIPFESDQDKILDNFASIIYQTLIGYYISAEPNSSHFGIANGALEGKTTSLLRREMEKLIEYFQNRSDIAGRLLSDVRITGKYQVPEPGDVFLADTIKKGLDIHVGYRIFSVGENVNCSRIFLPLNTGQEIINHIYYNIERILHQNFVTYDENSDEYLKITDSLVFKELESLITRSQGKDMTRKKIIDNLQFNTVFTPQIESSATEQAQVEFNDKLYDLLNQIQDEKYKSVGQNSRDLYTSFLQNNVGTEVKVPVKKIVQAPTAELVDAQTGEPSVASADLAEGQESEGIVESTSENVEPTSGIPNVRRKNFSRRPAAGGDSDRLVRRRKTASVTAEPGDSGRLPRRVKPKAAAPDRLARRTKVPKPGAIKVPGSRPLRKKPEEVPV